MSVTVLFFAGLREKMNRKEGQFNLVKGETVSNLAHRLLGSVLEIRSIDQSLLYAVNNSYVSADYQVQDGDEVVFIPPVAGG